MSTLTNSLPTMDRRARLALLQTQLGQTELSQAPETQLPETQAPENPPVEALLVTDPVSLRYLTGFTGSAGQLLVDRDRAMFMTDGRYRDQLGNELHQAQVSDLIDTLIGNPTEQMDALLAWLAESQLAESQLAESQPSAHQPSAHQPSTHQPSAYKLGVESESLTWDRAIALQKTLNQQHQQHQQAQNLPVQNLPAPAQATPTQATPVQATPTNAVVASLRARKDEGEIARIAAAAGIADEALADLLPRLTNQPTEREFARALDERMLATGAEALSFETICASGPNSALPHARPTNRRITKGDLVVIDFGAQLDGYHSDMTRTFCIGKPDKTQAQMLSTVTNAQQAGVEAVSAGTKCQAVDQACRAVIDAAQMGEEFVHGTGHGVGLQIHEAPWVGSSVQTSLQAGNVITVEPGVYRSGVGGVRVEDTVLVTADSAQRLTNAPKEAVI